MDKDLDMALYKARAALDDLEYGYENIKIITFAS